MVIGIFHPKRHIPRLDKTIDAVILGFLEHEKDYEIMVIRSDKYQKCDVAIRWGMSNGNERTKYRAAIDEHHKGPVGVVELGWLGDRRDTYFQFGFGGISGNAEYYLPPKDVMEQRFRNLGIVLPPPREQKPDDYILFCGQVPWDTSVQSVNYNSWVFSMIRIIQHHSKLPIRFRPHPLSRNRVHIGTLRGAGVLVDPGRTLQEDLAGARCTFTYNSNAAVDSLLAGVPAIVVDKGSMVSTITGRFIDQLNSPPFPSKEVLYSRMCEIASSQWTVEEFSKNIPWQLAKPHITKSLNEN